MESVDGELIANRFKASVLHSISFWFGICCIILGLLFNTRILGYLVASDSTRFHTVVLVAQVIILAIGLYMVIRRPILSLANILLACGSFSFALVLASTMCQILLPPVISGWRGHGNHSEKNQLDFRGHSINYTHRDYVVLLLGDSQVEALQCAFDYMPETRLEYYLDSKGKNVKVFSLGSGGYGQDQELLALREYYKKYRADLVLLWETPINDIWNNIFPTHWPTNGTPKPTFWLEHGQLMGPTEEIGEKVSYTAVKILSLFGNYLNINRRDTRWEERLPAAYKPLARYNAPVSYDWQRLWDYDEGIRVTENLAIEKSHWAFALTPRSLRMQYGLELTRRLLHEIKKLVVAKGGKFITFTVSPPQQKGSSDEKVHVLEGKYYRTSEHQYADNLNYMNADNDYIDVKIAFEKWRTGPLNAHLNEHATDEAMRKLADDLAEKIQDVTFYPAD
jgi:hypothetical protein